MKRFLTATVSLVLMLALLCLPSCTLPDFLQDMLPSEDPPAPSYDLSSVPAFDGVTAYVSINEGVPYFTESDYTTESFERYSELDSLGRCGVAYACVGVDLMPTEDRESISSVKPSGWQSTTYDHISGKYLYNRCHLIGFQLTGENANEKNLITGTRFLNIDGMLVFENMVADHVKELEHHVLYRVTPIYDGHNLVASGVLMEGYCVECDGEEIVFCIYAYNNQPGVVIDYATGLSRLSTDPLPDPTPGTDTPTVPEDVTYVLNTSSKKFHDPACSGVSSIKESNRQDTDKTREELIADGYSPCGTCKP